jgi:hypothetical protein
LPLWLVLFFTSGLIFVDHHHRGEQDKADRRAWDHADRTVNAVAARFFWVRARSPLSAKKSM